MPFERIAVKQYLPESLKVPLRRVVSFLSTRHFQAIYKLDLARTSQVAPLDVSEVLLADGGERARLPP